ncbi:hypothetical protein FOZ63_004524 [Perkinsus olseni]|uniref:Uncharacterized protein n=1 Tax=Perkinsus olseni TaxID=32597 RepID=A0A7J6TPF9_PEROL|nr:hypothetical protein FOZ62_004077 [Perkinsus olseni]KAF4747198.1 hypothetical protein FOZ63_004524 [Perkinsus olseni]
MDPWSYYDLEVLKALNLPPDANLATVFGVVSPADNDDLPLEERFRRFHRKYRLGPIKGSEPRPLLLDPEEYNVKTMAHDRHNVALSVHVGLSAHANPALRDNPSTRAELRRSRAAFGNPSMPLKACPLSWLSMATSRSSTVPLAQGPALHLVELPRHDPRLPPGERLLLRCLRGTQESGPH